MNSRLVDRFRDDPANPDCPSVNQPEVRLLLAHIAPGSQGTDLGGVMSLNVSLEPAGLVLRVHQPFVTRPRLPALQDLRRALVGRGLLAPLPVSWRGHTVFPCGDRLAELEEYIPHERLKPEPASYTWLFGATGALDRATASLDLRVLVATYAPPGSLSRCPSRPSFGLAGGSLISLPPCLHNLNVCMDRNLPLRVE